MIEYFHEQLDVIRESFTNFPADDYKTLVAHCITTLKRGGKIIASGLGKNVPICEKFVGTMNSFGLDARFLHTNSAVHGDLGMAGGNDIILLLSKSGNTEESVVLAQHLLQRGVETWLLSFNENSRLSSMLDNRLIMCLKNEGDLWNIVPNNSTIVYLILLQGIAIQIVKDFKIGLDDFKVNHPGGGIGEHIFFNDRKPSELQTAYAVNLERDKGLEEFSVVVDEGL